MKRIFVTAITLVVVMFSSTAFACTAFASLSEGTWTSFSGQIRTGTWGLTTYGNLSDTGVMDSRSYPTGLGYSWEYLGSVVNNITWTGFIPITDSPYYYRYVTGSFSGGDYPYKFNINGDSYTITNTYGLFSIRMKYASDYTFLQTIDSDYLCQGIVDQAPDYMMTITSKLVVKGDISPFTVGTMNNIKWYINPVPIPATLWIFGSGLLGIIGLRRRISQ